MVGAIWMLFDAVHIEKSAVDDFHNGITVK